MTNTIKNLINLDELSGYKVAEHYSDVRGWKVKDKNNRTIGKVVHLLVNKATERVVYLDVEVDASLMEEEHDVYQDKVIDGVHEFLNKKGESHLIIPIGMAMLDKENKLVKTDQIDSFTFGKAKRFKMGDVIDFDYELNLVRHFRGDKSIHNSNDTDGFYDLEEFNNPFFWHNV